MLEALEKTPINQFLFQAHPGSGKSTIGSTAYPLWSIVGDPQKTFLVLASQTKRRAKDRLENILQELNQNALLRQDLFPRIAPNKKVCHIERDTLIIPSLDARIKAVGVGESVRGLMHGGVRPQIIIGDDIEDRISVQNMQKRLATRNWIEQELLSIGDKDTIFIFLANFLGRGSYADFVTRKVERTGRQVCILDMPILSYGDEKPCWPERYTLKDIQNMQARAADPIAWKREFLNEETPMGKYLQWKDFHWYEPDEPTKNMIIKSGRYKMLYHPTAHRYGYAPMGGGLTDTHQITCVYGAELFDMKGYDFYAKILPPILEIQEEPGASIQLFELMQGRRAEMHEKIKHTSRRLEGPMRISMLSSEKNKEMTKSLYEKGTAEVSYMKLPSAKLSDMIQHLVPYIQQGRITFAKEYCKDLVQDLIEFPNVETTARIEAFLALVPHYVSCPGVTLTVNDKPHEVEPFIPTKKEEDRMLRMEIAMGKCAKYLFKGRVEKDLMTQEEYDELIEREERIFSQGEHKELYEYYKKRGGYRIPYHQKSYGFMLSEEKLEMLREGVRREKAGLPPLNYDYSVVSRETRDKLRAKRKKKKKTRR